MEEPLQPRAAQLRAGALREQSGEAPPGPPGPAQRFFHIPAAPYSAQARCVRQFLTSVSSHTLLFLPGMLFPSSPHTF